MKYPIFIPHREILEGNTLYGFCCKDISDARGQVEKCGLYEPDKWLGQLYVEFRKYPFNEFRYKGDPRKIWRKYPTDDFGFMVKQLISCIALYPNDDGSFLVTGRRHAHIQFIHGSIPAIENPNEIVGLCLSSYQPEPLINVHCEVTVTECTVTELIDKLDSLIIH